MDKIVAIDVMIFGIILLGSSDILKLETVTPVPKVNSPKTVNQLRNISGLLNLDKIAEKSYLR